MRLAHLLWHGVRDYWAQLSAAEQLEFRTRFPTWAPTHPSRNKNGEVIFDTGAGLDFLYAHRQMICHVNCLLEELGKPPVTGWTTPPRVDDPEFPAVKEYRFPPSIYRSKDDSVWSAVVEQTEAFLRPSNLKTVSLDRLGTTIEYGIHAAMHERFGGYSKSDHLRPGQASMLARLGRKWNLRGYDSLLDAYSSHVHPWFWKIHVWIDGLIGLWERETGKTADWTNAWIGPMHECHGDHMGGDEHGGSHGGHSHDGGSGQPGQPQDEDALVEDLADAILMFKRTAMDGVFRPLVFVPKKQMMIARPTVITRPGITPGGVIDVGAGSGRVTTGGGGSGVVAGGVTSGGGTGGVTPGGHTHGGHTHAGHTHTGHTHGGGPNP